MGKKSEYLKDKILDMVLRYLVAYFPFGEILRLRFVLLDGHLRQASSDQSI
jgi:hypothetical protein